MRLVTSLPLRRVPLKTTAAITSCPSVVATASIHTHPAQPAKVSPISGIGPPPPPPPPPAQVSPDSASRILRRRTQVELLRKAKDLRAASASKATGGTFTKRFWKEVHVREVDRAYEIHLDTRPLRRPNSKTPVRIPLSKPHLAHAVGIEWDQLVSVQEATRQHLIPLTSTVCRALDIADDDAAHAGSPPAPIRARLTESLLRYLDTDSLLCWAPPPDLHNPLNNNNMTNAAGETLHDVQARVAAVIVADLTTCAWPGVTIIPVFEGNSIFPRSQAPGTRDIIQSWILRLSSWELAGLERATLAGKSLLVGARLVLEWSEEGAGAVAEESKVKGGDSKSSSSSKELFGVEEAARASSLEVSWQTGKWGEVEDTHDVEKEDLRRQLGSVVLLVSGNGSLKR
ncbi:hypothetical protein B0T26DRAFT_657897 [Lasiosphaeria miniovina]|uniref:Uncharacterized protein n=1 Tax=Lasiosphaeria miniovina TaxID=1954250 RepID=A0AA40DJX2_9PEZI|nr:uncharacterized protein B0T26DRAFT_657897 [Lasiosphaeria miniovina]KAK0703507.1 hypothetical protein B0T26DRAFT_657897 [Lasiosphaeria miniovina]